MIGEEGIAHTRSITCGELMKSPRARVKGTSTRSKEPEHEADGDDGNVDDLISNSVMRYTKREQSGLVRPVFTFMYLHSYELRSGGIYMYFFNRDVALVRCTSHDH